MVVYSVQIHPEKQGSVGNSLAVTSRL
ncbi:hypothetical protein AZE42_03639 [Rhizopogon vesiculosus]|uniref:Uncharacterized protein n=1 Tax=Rhizopogon vesiculosus TaxID=180088 RepID=A0A1J8PXF8_9AGAM|nr:hypothetical protein AZE42_03639 [Rhizopogon vesiculosus]